MQYRAAKLVTGTFQFTSRDKLNLELGWQTIKSRSDNLGHQFNVRSKGGYKPFKNLGVKFKNAFFPYTANLWTSLPQNVRTLSVSDFKEYINKESKPPEYKHYSRGNKISNSLLTKLRVGRSDLNQHKFTIGLIDSPQCDCHFREESTSHFFLDCFLYVPERQVMFDLFEHYIPKFKTFTKHKKLDIILRGINPENDELVSTNTTLTIAVQNFITHTNRCS